MRKSGPLLSIVLVFILTALGMVRVYDQGKDQRPLLYADIPQGTIDWLGAIGGELGDLLSSFNPEPRPTPWGNDGDLGRDAESGLKTLEDTLFVFYFPDALTGAAHLCRTLAHQAVPHLEAVMGHYFYPSEMNSRKVPVYLTEDLQGFTETVRGFGGEKEDYSSVAGITMMELSPSGMYLKGIVINGEWGYTDEAFTRHVLWHELSHYCFFAAIDYSQNVNLPVWTYEGIAEYASLPDACPTFTEEQIQAILRECSLQAPHFPQVFENYQGAHSLFCFMRDGYRDEGVKSFLGVLYLQGLPSAMEEVLGTDIPAFEASWKAHLTN